MQATDQPTGAKAPFNAEACGLLARVGLRPTRINVIPGGVSRFFRNSLGTRGPGPRAMYHYGTTPGYTPPLGTRVHPVPHAAHGDTAFGSAGRAGCRALGAGSGRVSQPGPYQLPVYPTVSGSLQSPFGHLFTLFDSRKPPGEPFLSFSRDRQVPYQWSANRVSRACSAATRVTDRGRAVPHEEANATDSTLFHSFHAFLQSESCASGFLRAFLSGFPCRKELFSCRSPVQGGKKMQKTLKTAQNCPF